MEKLKACDTCPVYAAFWCGGCKHSWSCRIRKNKTKVHRIADGCQFSCTDEKYCKEKERVTHDEKAKD